jgi:catechol 2,3-dioxygenase-like lactoylglutathione lyase family enzyme
MITKVTHLTLFVTNQDNALKFYTESLGFKVHTDAMFGPDFRWLTICPPEQPDFEIAILKAETPEEKALVGKQGAGKPFFSLATTDCRKDFELLSSRGVKFAQEPKVEEWGISAAFQDLEGNMIYMCQQ